MAYKKGFTILLKDEYIIYEIHYIYFRIEEIEGGTKILVVVSN